MNTEAPAATPQKPSALSIIIFLLLTTSLISIIFFGQLIAWVMEQLAIADISLGVVAPAGKIWFITQALATAVVAGICFVIFKDSLRPIYGSWAAAALVSLPALGLRWLGPNQDQIGALIQILLSLFAGAIILFFRRRSFNFGLRQSISGWAIIPLGIWPFLLWGAFGDPSDMALNLLAGLTLGILTASLMPKPSGNVLPDGIGLTVLLMILGSAIGYDGGQLILLLVLPAFGLAIAAMQPSVPTVILTVGLLAAAPLMLVDPTELSIVLGDFFNWAFYMTMLMTAIGWVISIALWLLSLWKDRPRSIYIPIGVGMFGWGALLMLFFFFGQHGFHGDRLFVILKKQADLSPAAQIQDVIKRRSFVYQTLTETAKSSQATLRQDFERLHIDYTPYYLVNAIEVDDSPLVRLYLMSQPEVDRVIPSPHLRPLPAKSEGMASNQTEISENPGWNIKMIGADRVWAEFNAKGQGILIGQADSGVDGQHPALTSTYHGKSAGDDYNWYDPWFQTKSPNDGQGHGTHTLGTILGQGGIGIAPQAEWIACVNLGRNLGNPALYLDCMQFLFAPFPQQGDSFAGDPTRGAQIFNNSWGCPPIEGCDANALKAGVDALRAAGVFVVASAGNDGPNCQTVNAPLSLYDSVFTVGAINQYGELAEFSSRGPVTADGSRRVKPDIVAPGVDVFSALPGGGYAEESGTSMAGPHLVGVVALLWSANPKLIGNIDATEKLLIETAKPIAISQRTVCGGIGPYNAIGYGLVDVYAAVKKSLGK